MPQVVALAVSGLAEFRNSPELPTAIKRLNRLRIVGPTHDQLCDRRMTIRETAFDPARHDAKRRPSRCTIFTRGTVNGVHIDLEVRIPQRLRDFLCDRPLDPPIGDNSDRKAEG